MKICIACCMIFFSLASCNQQDAVHANSQHANKSALMEADRAFSSLCESKGMKQAFIEYIDSNGVLLRPNSFPIVGAKAIDFLIQQDDQGYSLTWEPQYAEVAASGDLGYTFGVYEVTPKSRDTSIYGSYVSIWKKQHDGKWKFVLDTGNEGIGNQID